MGAKQKPVILVADDDKFIRDRLSVLFQKEGYSVKTAKSGAEAMAAVEEGGIDIAIIDYHMEDRTGGEVAEDIKKKAPEVPVIMMTGDESIELERHVREKGVFAYFMKPLELEMLKKIVAAARKSVSKSVN